LGRASYDEEQLASAQLPQHATLSFEFHESSLLTDLVVSSTAPGAGCETMIRDEWIECAIESPVRELVQADGRICRWVQVPEDEGRYLRVVTLSDGETERIL
jgi:hypothetical protein